MAFESVMPEHPVRGSSDAGRLLRLLLHVCSRQAVPISKRKEFPLRRFASSLIALLIVALMGCSRSSTVTGPGGASAQWMRASSGLPGGGTCTAFTVSGTTRLAGTNSAGIWRYPL